MTNDKQRERLVELFEQLEDPSSTCPHMGTGEACEGCEYLKGDGCDLTGRFVDYLLANGVIVPPCKVGNVLYSIDDCIKRPEKIVVTAVHQYKKYTSINALSRSQREYFYEEKDFGKYVFLTKEEAEEALGKKLEEARERK